MLVGVQYMKIKSVLYFTHDTMGTNCYDGCSI